MKYGIKIIISVLIILGCVSCSSAPKKPAEILTVRGIGKTQLQLANREIDRGNNTGAMAYIDDAWNCAVRTDDPELRIKVRLSRGNAHLYLGDFEAARRDWKDALDEADSEGMEELAAAARIHSSRGSLLEAIANGKVNPGLASQVGSSVLGEMGNIKSEQTYIALAWMVAGLAEKEQGLWDKAEKSFTSALQIHEKGNYLEQAAYDWYLIASARSQAKQYGSAVDALFKAVSFDRRAENSYGLGSNWMALGDVYRKMGETGKARDAYQRSAEIFGAIAMEGDALLVKGKLESL